MVRRIPLLCLCVWMFLQAAWAHAEIQVGAASRVITPDPRLTLHAPRFPVPGLARDGDFARNKKRCGP